MSDSVRLIRTEEFIPHGTPSGTPRVPACGVFNYWDSLMSGQRVSCFIDGFNLYHAIHDMGEDHLKWVDLWSLMGRYTLSAGQTLCHVYYFSAYADWLPKPKKRHVEYVKALQSTGVTIILGKFKKKDRYCPSCKHRWIGHEEKETDVNIALALLNEAYKDSYDRALIISRDSDLAPAIEMARSEFPEKTFCVVAPPNRGHSTELTNAGTDKAKIKKKTIEGCLLPELLHDVSGHVIARRPAKYDPPALVAGLAT